MSNYNQSWLKKYEPKLSSEIVGQEKALGMLSDFVNNYKKQKKRSCLLWGPPGSGKTISVHALARELDLEVLEVNASDVRNKDGINAKVGIASKQMSLFSKGKIILIDEVDGLSGMKDRGAIAAVTTLLDESAFPIVLTTVNPYEKKLKGIRKKAELIEFTLPSSSDVTSVLKKVAVGEGVSGEDLAFSSLARRSGGDIRAAINDLQLLSQHTKSLRVEDLKDLSQRDKDEEISAALVKVLKITDPVVALSAFDQVTENLDECLLWVEENVMREYTKPEDLAKAFDHISKADVYRGRIRRWQYWRFLVYVNAHLTAGVATSKKEKYPGMQKYEQSKRLLKIWMLNMKYQKRKAIAEKIAEKNHCSTRRAVQDVLPYVRFMVRQGGVGAEGLSDYFGFDKEEVAWMMK